MSNRILVNLDHINTVSSILHFNHSESSIIELGILVELMLCKNIAAPQFRPRWLFRTDSSGLRWKFQARLIENDSLARCVDSRAFAVN